MQSPRTLTALRLLLAVLLTSIVAHATSVLGDGAPTLNSPWSLILTIPAFLGVPILSRCLELSSFVLSQRNRASLNLIVSWHLRPYCGDLTLVYKRTY